MKLSVILILIASHYRKQLVLTQYSEMITNVVNRTDMKKTIKDIPAAFLGKFAFGVDLLENISGTSRTVRRERMEISRFYHISALTVVIMLADLISGEWRHLK